MKKYVPKIKLQEMAHIGDIGQLSIDVYTDHEPKHFHVKKKDEFEVKLTIKSLAIIDYVWQKNNKEISTKEIKSIKEWLISKNIKNKKLTNKEAINFAWNIMN